MPVFSPIIRSFNFFTPGTPATTCTCVLLRPTHLYLDSVNEARYVLYVSKVAGFSPYTLGLGTAYLTEVHHFNDKEIMLAIHRLSLG